jgi:hypothetical protein
MVSPGVQVLLVPGSSQAEQVSQEAGIAAPAPAPVLVLVLVHFSAEV